MGATSKSTQLLTNVWVKLLLLLENALNSILRHSNWKFESIPSPHAHSDLIVNKHTEQVKKLHMDLSWDVLTSLLLVKTLYHANTARIWLSWVKIPPKPAEIEPSFRKVGLKLRMLFPAHLWVREFWPQLYSLWQAQDWGLLSKILASWKWAGPRMLKGQPWPVDAIHFPACSSGASAASQTFTLTAAS